MPTSRFSGFSLTACLWLLVIGGAIGVEAQMRSYVAHPGDGLITVLDTQTNAVVDKITVCTDHTCTPLIPAVTPNGARIYVTNVSQNTVTVIDTLTNTVIDTITVGQAPWGIAITPDGNRAYVANTSGTISVIDTATNTVTATITDSDGPSGVAITPDGTRAYVSNGQGTVSVVDTGTNTILTNIPITDFPVPCCGFPAFSLVAIALTPDGSRGYVVSASTGKTYVIDTATNSMIATILTNPGQPLSIAMKPDGTRVYTASVGFQARAFVIDTASNTILATISAGGAPPFVGVTPDGTKFYIDGDMAVTIIDTATNTISTRIQLDLTMGGVAFGTLPEVPQRKEDCKDSGFQRFSALAFRNQGQCVKYVTEHAH